MIIGGNKHDHYGCVIVCYNCYRSGVLELLGPPRSVFREWIPAAALAQGLAYANRPLKKVSYKKAVIPSLSRDLQLFCFRGISRANSKRSFDKLRMTGFF